MTFLNRHRSRIRPVGPFSPSSLFFGGIPGAWYDPTDLSTMFQDSAGTTPVTAVEQPVGLILDKSQGLAQGSQLVVNGDGTTLTGWTPVNDAGCTTTVSGGQFVLTTVASGGARLRQTIPVTAGKTYAISIFINANNDSGANSFQIWGTGYGAGTLVFAPQVFNGVFTAIVQATSANLYLQLNAYRAASGTVAYYDDVSVRELAGNHASQSTAASRPTYRARYNLVEQSEVFSNAYWTKSSTTISADAGTAPDGTVTADLAYPTTTGTARIVWRNLVPGINGQRYTVSVYAKASGKSILYFGTLQGNTAPDADLPFFNLTTGQVAQAGAYFDTVTIQSVGSGWYRCTATKNAVTSANLYPIFGVADASGNTTATTNGTDGIFIWGAQLLTAADVTATGNAYQRIAAATVYDTAPVFRPYLAFDGLDDSLSTAAINFTSTDKMTTFVGTTVNSDAAPGMITELSADGGANAGAFNVYRPGTGAYQFFRNGGTSFAQTVTGSFAAPSTGVVTYGLNFGAATEVTAQRVNGAASGAVGAADTGSGNFGTYPLFIGRRNNASLPFNGRIYELIVRGAASSVTEIADTELWVNARTGGY